MPEEHRWDWGKDRFFTTDPILRAIFITNGCTVDPAFELPRRHKESFEKELRELFDTYQERLKKAIGSSALSMGQPYSSFPDDGSHRMCDGILNALQSLHDGYPSRAYDVFADMMDELTDAVPLPRVRDVIWPDPSIGEKADGRRSLDFEPPRTVDAAMAEQFYRVRSVSYGSTFPRYEIFHTPVSLRDKISTSRYSIAGYPSLYLADALKLSMQEMGQPYHSIASSFKLAGTRENESGLVIDLGIRPQDFIFPKMKSSKGGVTKKLDTLYTHRYIFWFPLLAACSFVRENPSSSYSDEYAIPQLLMQWLRLSKRPPLNMKYPDETFEMSDADILDTEYKTYKTRLDRILRFIHREIESSEAKLDGLRQKLPKSIPDRLTELKSITSLLIKTTLRYPGFIFPRDFYELLRKIDRTLLLLKEALSGSEKDLSGLTSFDSPTGLKLDNGANETNLNDREIDGLLRSLGSTRRLLAWLDDYRIVGIRYFSCKDLYAPLLGRNYVFPSERITLDRNGKVSKDGEGLYSSQLNRLFSWSVPRHREDYESVQGWQDGLDDELLRNPGNLGGDTWESMS